MILNDEQQSDVKDELLARRTAGLEETWEEEQIRNALDTIAELERQLAERERGYRDFMGLLLGKEYAETGSQDLRAALEAYVQERVDHAELPFGLVNIIAAADEGLKEWASKPHNAKWWKRIDGTPIPNDLLVNVTDAIWRMAKSAVSANRAKVKAHE